jgi:hypothetical protein
MLGEGSHPIESVGTNRELVPCFVEPRLSSQVSQDFSRIPVFLGFRGRRKNFDHVDFPQSADQAETTHLSDFSSRPMRPAHSPYGVLCNPAPTRGAGSSSRTWNTPPVVSTFDPMHHPAT